jgi:hypothetical protein
VGFYRAVWVEVVVEFESHLLSVVPHLTKRGYSG